MEMVEVTVKRPHRSGYAQGRAVKTGDRYSVPGDRLPSLLRQGLIEDPAEPAPAKPKRHPRAKKLAEEPIVIDSSSAGDENNAEV